MSARYNLWKPQTDCLTEAELFGYAEGRLSKEAIRKVEEHISTCAFCADALEGILSSGNLAASRKALKEAQEAILKKTKQRSVIPVKRWMQAAAALVFLVASAWMINTLVQKSAEKIFSDEFAPYPPAATKPAVSPVTKDSVLLPLPEIKPDKEVGPSTHDVQHDMAEKVPADEDQVSEDASETLPVIVPELPAEADDILTAPEQQSSESYAAPQTATKTTRNQAVDKNNGKDKKSTAVRTEAVAASDVQVFQDSEFNKAMVFYQQEKYREAIDGFNRILQNNPAYAEAAFYAGVSYLAIERADSCLMLLELTNDRNSTFYEASLWYQALAFVKLDNKKEARRLANQLVKLDGSYRAKAEELLKDL